MPDETGGPYPGDGSNGPNVLDDSGIVRSDITSSFGSSTTTAEGVPLTINLTVTDAGNGYAAMAGAAVYLWHCDRDGQYSLYSQGISDENYLRGVQATNASGDRDVHEHLPRGLLRSLAAHPLRGLPVPRPGHEQRPDRQDVTDRPPGGSLHGGLRHEWLRAERRAT